MTRLLICRTCPRYEPVPRDGAPTGGALLGRLAKLRVGGPDVRVVNCLAGCLFPCNAAIEGDGKVRLRFSRLTPDDLDALFAASAAHERSADGNLETEIPAELRDRLTARSPSRIGE